MLALLSLPLQKKDNHQPEEVLNAENPDTSHTPWDVANGNSALKNAEDSELSSKSVNSKEEEKSDVGLRCIVIIVIIAIIRSVIVATKEDSSEDWEEEFIVWPEDYSEPEEKEFTDSKEEFGELNTKSSESKDGEDMPKNTTKKD